MPTALEQINFDNIKDLQIGDGELYWKGNKLKTISVQHFALSFWQWLTGAVIALGAIAAPSVTYVAELEKICNVTDQSAPLCDLLDMKIRFPKVPAVGANIIASPPPAASASR